MTGLLKSTIQESRKEKISHWKGLRGPHNQAQVQQEERGFALKAHPLEGMQQAFRKNRQEKSKWDMKNKQASLYYKNWPLLQSSEANFKVDCKQKARR